MTVETALQAAHAAGATVRVDNGQLKVGKANLLPAELADSIRALKPEIMAFLIDVERMRVDCPTFTVRPNAIESVACCLSCGGSWELHGKPPRNAWVLTEDEVPVRVARYILANEGTVAA
jgi:hypothetical protein